MNWRSDYKEWTVSRPWEEQALAENSQKYLPAKKTLKYYYVLMIHISNVITSYGDGFAALWRYPDRSSPAQLPCIPYPWLSSAWRVPKVGHTSRYDITSWQPCRCARICTDNRVTSMTWFVWRKKIEFTTWCLYQIPHTWCDAILHINDCLYPDEYSTK